MSHASEIFPLNHKWSPAVDRDFVLPSFFFTTVFLGVYTTKDVVGERYGGGGRRRRLVGLTVSLCRAPLKAVSAASTALLHDRDATYCASIPFFSHSVAVYGR